MTVPSALARADAAASIQELKDICDFLPTQAQNMLDAGQTIQAIATHISEINKTVLRRLYNLVAPRPLCENACLVVMGSDGRGEQILRADQDNALILREGADRELALKVAQDIDDILRIFGFPPCPGGMMLSNPEWTKTLIAYEGDFFRWAHAPSENGHLRLAAFADAQAVAGDTKLLAEARTSLFRTLSNRPGFYAHFAHAIQSFDIPLGWFHKIRSEKGAVDIKKGGIFPIVHGVRSLALERQIKETNSFERLSALTDIGVLSSAFAEETAQALRIFLTLRLKNRLTVQQNAASLGNHIILKNLARSEYDALCRALLAAKRFRAWIERHFQLMRF